MPSMRFEVRAVQCIPYVVSATFFLRRVMHLNLFFKYSVRIGKQLKKFLCRLTKFVISQKKIHIICLSVLATYKTNFLYEKDDENKRIKMIFLSLSLAFSSVNCKMRLKGTQGTCPKESPKPEIFNTGNYRKHKQAMDCRLNGSQQKTYVQITALRVHWKRENCLMLTEHLIGY